MILLHCDVASLHLRPINLILLLNHDGCKPSSSSSMTKNVPDVVVAKHQRRTIVAARRVISEHIHHILTSFAFACEGRTRESSVEKRKAQTKLERSTKDVRL